MSSGCEVDVGVGPVVVSAGSGSVHHSVGRVECSVFSRDSRCSTQLCSASV